MTGTIKLHDKIVGFGFIEGENGKQYYTQFDGLSLEEKARADQDVPVSFDLQEGLRGEEAVNVKLLS